MNFIKRIINRLCEYPMVSPDLFDEADEEVKKTLDKLFNDTLSLKNQLTAYAQMLADKEKYEDCFIELYRKDK